MHWGSLYTKKLVGIVWLNCGVGQTKKYMDFCKMEENWVDQDMSSEVICLVMISQKAMLKTKGDSENFEQNFLPVKGPEKRIRGRSSYYQKPPTKRALNCANDSNLFSG